MKALFAVAMSAAILTAPWAGATDELGTRLREVQSRLLAMGDRVISEEQWSALMRDLADLVGRARAAGADGIAVEAIAAQARAWGDLRRAPAQAAALARAGRAEFAGHNRPELRQLYLIEAEMLARLGDADGIRRVMSAYKASPVYDPPPFAYTATPDPKPVVAMVRPRAPQTESPVLLAMQKYLEQALAAPGGRMPDFLLVDIDGLRYSNGSIQGRVVLLDFWVAGSVPWERELPMRIRAREKFAAQGFEILGVCQNLDADGIRAHVAARPGMTWPQVEGRTARDLIVRLGIPGENASFLLDRQGRIRGRNLQGAELIEAVARILAESP